MESENHFDYIVIGAGSGGVASSRWTAKFHGTKVAIIEHQALGGTCVNVGCVPKKCMFNAAAILDDLHVADSYGLSGSEGVKLDFSILKEHRDKYIKRLNGIYDDMLANNKVTLIRGWGKFVDSKTVEVNGTDRYTADHILIATGGKPNDGGFEGAEHTINSNGFFELEQLPKRAIVLGGGYIAVELGQIFHSLGTKVTQIVRSEVLRGLVDVEIRQVLYDTMELDSYDIRKGLNISKIEKIAEGNMTVHLTDGSVIEEVDCVLQAIGRSPNTSGLDCDKAGVELDSRGYVKVDEYENTNVPGIYALGDVTGKIELTPVAVKAGRTLVERLFNKREGLKMDYANVPTVTFSHPPIGMVGLTEAQAKEKFGEENVGVYKSKFVNMFHSLMQDLDKRPKSLIKYITNKADEDRIVGLHLIGRNVDEMLQGASIAIKMGATKKDYDSCVAIHPTGSEELVLMDPLI